MILNSQPKQLRLQDDGQILWQADASNPLPGQPVARVEKGESQLRPRAVLIETEILQGQDKDAVAAFIQSWLEQHIATVLEILHGLTKEEGIDGPAKAIAQKVHDALGILPRQDLESDIAGLDPETRKVLRQRHVRLGPILVFVPELNKPAAVRLRALLWWLWHDRPLPAPVPKDGAVSVVVDEAQSDPLYYRAIGYPLYAGRAIRVDMLDRVISAVYDSAKDGSFKATHAMAEWLGCSIPDLYKVLEAMGHKKTHDPADAPAPAAAETAAPAETPAAETAATDPAPAAEAEASAAPAAPVQPVKPELATFRLKRGKANEAARAPRPPREARPEKPKFEKKPEHGKDRKFKPRDKDKRDKFAREEKKQVSFEARPKHVEDSPFAVLQQLKAGNKDS
ncbi:MAG: hypothetical protein HYU57_03560 [Micavibrio aeruginosavorus]|nr:hypothetical protein [Micavibrio aeruginosavorus]